jgi:hypothetical protein
VFPERGIYVGNACSHFPSIWARMWAACQIVPPDTTVSDYSWGLWRVNQSQRG